MTTSLAQLACACLPWLLLTTAGPSPTVLGFLASAFCLTGLWMVARFEGFSAQGVAGGWLVAALLSSAMALCQYFGLAEHWEPWVSASQGVAYANLRQRNQFASLTVVGFAALLYLGRMKPSVALRCRVLTASAMVLLVAGNAASSSRTGLVALAMVCLIAMGWRACQGVGASWRIVFWALPAYILAALSLPWLAGHAGPGWNVFSRLAEGDAACSSRLTLWSNVMHLIAQKPWIGWGWGELDYAHFVTLFPGERFCAILDNAHNLPLHLAVELGVPASLLLCGAFLSWLARLRPWAEVDADRQLAYSVLAILLLHSMLEFPLWYGPFQMAFLLCLIILGRQQPLPAMARPAPMILGKATAVAIILMAMLAYVAWDYHRISQIFLAPEQRSAAYRDDTLAKSQGSWLFRGQVQFAELGTTPLTPGNAASQHALALRVLHFSPEPLVVERLIESALALGRTAEARFYQHRYAAAFPKEYQAWTERFGPHSGEAP